MSAKLSERYIKALQALGETPVIGRTNKYWQMTRKEGGYYFIGRHGALRHGQTVTGSVPCSDMFKYKLLGKHEGII